MPFSGRPWRIDGVVKGERVQIFLVAEGPTRSPTVYTVVEMSVSPQITRDFKVTKEGLFAKVGKTFRLVNDIDTGDVEFDPNVLISGADAWQVQQQLALPGLRGQILAALREYPAMEISGQSIRVRRVGRVSETAYHAALIDTMAGIAEVLNQRSPPGIG